MNKGRCKRLLAFVLCVSMIGSMVPVQTKAAGAASQANDSAEADAATSDHYDDNGFCKGYEIDPNGTGSWVKKTGDDACTDDTCNGYQPMTTVTEDGTTWYEISNAGQLYWFADQVDNGNLLDANVRLTADIVDNESVTFGWDESNNYAVVATKDGQTVDVKTLRMWNPIGEKKNGINHLFAGHFDGQGHTVSGLYYDTDKLTDFDAGVFWRVSGTSACYTIIEKVGLENSYLHSGKGAGGITGYANYATIRQCYNAAYLVSERYSGGIAALTSYCITLNEVFNFGEMMIVGNWSGQTGRGQIVGLSYAASSADPNYEANYCYARSDLNIKSLGDSSYSINGMWFFPKESFYNGEVAYQLSQLSSTWGQDLYSNNSLPNPSASDRYPVYKTCTGYTNDKNEVKHSIKNGLCTNVGCDYYEGEPYYNEAEEVYEISNAGQLYAYADKAQTVYTKGARLMADIVVNEDTLIYEDGTPVTEMDDLMMWKGLFREEGYPYYNDQKLVFDGNNHSISGLYAKGSGLQGFALHNYGTVKNLQIKNSVCISTDSKAGGIDAGYTAGPADYKVESCSFEGYVEGATDAGGIVGGNHNISNCYVDAYVNGETVNPISPNGKITNTAYNTDKYTDGCTTSGVQGFTTDQFESGEVAYALNHPDSDTATDTWKQTLDGESKDSTPTLNEKSSTVYRYNSTNCAGNDKNPIVYVYTNDANNKDTNVNDPHTYEPDTENLTQHKCSVCGDTEEHTFTYKKVDNDNAIIATCSVCGATYTVKLTKPAAASDGKLVYDGTAKKAEATIESGNTGIETIPESAITYAAVTDAKTCDYSTIVPKDAGTYKAKLTLGTGDNVVSIETEFTIEQATPVIVWSENQTNQSATYTGEVIAVSKITAPTVTLLEGDTFRDTDKISYSYREIEGGTASGDFNSGLPTKLGTYEIKASLPAEGNYTAAETADTMQLTIVYLEGAPDAVVTDKNDKIYNSEDWCPSDIVLKAPDGYKISVEVNGDYKDSCTYTGTTEEETITYYLKADNSGEIAEKSVAVKMDRTAPDWGEDKEELGIHIRKNWWNSLLGTITFGVYKGTLDVYVQANDSGMGVTEYDYYIDKSGSTTALTAEELDSLADQNEFEKVEVTEDLDAATKLTEIGKDDHYVIYAYAVDAAGNKSAYISSDGVVLDNTAPVISDVEKPTKEAKTLTDTTATITFTGSEAGTCYYILHELEDDADAKAPKGMGDFAEKEIAEEYAQVDTWKANNGVATQELTGDADNTIELTELKVNTSYVLYLAATDAAGNASVVEYEAAEGEDSGIVSVSFTTAKTVPYVQIAPVLSGRYGDKLSELAWNMDCVVVASQGSTKKVLGRWSMASEDEDKIPTVGTSEKYILTFTPTGSDADTYDKVTCEVTPEISKKQIIVMIANKEKFYGDEIPELTWKSNPLSLGGKTYNTLVNGDTEEALGISLSTTAEDNSNVGTYAITGSSDSANYEVYFTGSGLDDKSGVLTVKKAANEFTTALSCSDYTYAKDKTPEPKAAARFGTVTYKYATADFDGNAYTAPSDESLYTDIIPVNAGTYAVKAYVAETENYAGLTSDPVVFTIAKAAKAPNMPGETMTPAHSIEKVGDITLPDGWSWSDADKDTVLADGMAVTATAEYVGSDKGNYETESVTVTITRSACTHANTELRNAKEATCTQDGYSGDTYCTICDTLVESGQTIPASGHKLTKVEAKEATATEAGNREYFKCDICGEYFEDGEGKAAITDKNSVVILAKPAKKGTILTETKSGAAYKVTGSDPKKPEVEYKAPKNKKQTKAVIPDTVTIDGVEYAVTSIAKNAFKNNKKLTEVKIGKNVTSIGDNAFSGCKNLRKVEIDVNLVKIGKNAFKNCKRLKTITIKSTKLNKKNVKKGAFKGISSKAVFKVPKSKLASYRKLFRSKGLSKKARFKKY